jgi:hypothetical protein
VLLVLLFPAVMLVIALINRDPAWLAMLLTTLVIALGLAGLITLLNVVSIRSASKKQYQSSKAMQTESELVIDETGLRESSECGSTIVAWEEVIRAEEAPTAYYVFFSRMQAFVITKRLLALREEETLRAFLSAHLPTKKLKLQKGN